MRCLSSSRLPCLSSVSLNPAVAATTPLSPTAHRVMPNRLLAHAHVKPFSLLCAQNGRLPLHNAVMQPNELSFTEANALLNAHPEGVTQKDKVRGQKAQSSHFFLVCICRRVHALPCLHSLFPLAEQKATL